jgi:hypothetical protein
MSFQIVIYGIKQFSRFLRNNTLYEDGGSIFFWNAEPTYPTSEHHILEDYDMNFQCCEILKSHRVRVFENKVLKILFVSKIDNETKEQRYVYV